jgi:hypothetical protein
MAHGAPLYRKELQILVQQSEEDLVDLPSSIPYGGLPIPHGGLPEENKASKYDQAVLGEQCFTGKQGALVVPDVLAYSDHDSFVKRQAARRPFNLQYSGGIKVC